MVKIWCGYHLARFAKGKTTILFTGSSTAIKQGINQPNVIGVVGVKTA
jgi:hypothetical protein